MTMVTAQMSISLDGCYAGPRHDVDPADAESWMAGPGAPGFFRVTRWVVDAMSWRERQGFAGGGASVTGRGTIGLDDRGLGEGRIDEGSAR